MADSKFTDQTPIPFGKYRGTPLGQVPAKYLLWLYNKGCYQHQTRRYIIDNLEALKKETSYSKR